MKIKLTSIEKNNMFAFLMRSRPYIVHFKSEEIKRKRFYLGI